MEITSTFSHFSHFEFLLWICSLLSSSVSMGHCLGGQLAVPAEKKDQHNDLGGCPPIRKIFGKAILSRSLVYIMAQQQSAIILQDSEFAAKKFMELGANLRDSGMFSGFNMISASMVKTTNEIPHRWMIFL